MKKAVAALLAAALLGVFAPQASALGKTFTHPEIGEPLTVAFADFMPLFKIYGFTYYQIPWKSAPMRGLLANLPETIHAAMPSLEESLEAIYQSAQAGRDTGQFLGYSGEMAQYGEALDALGPSDWVRAVSLLGGFHGAQGLDELAGVPGFGNAGVSGLRDGFTEFTARVAGARYPYRVLQFFVEEPQNEEYFFERYGFLFLDGEWRLSRTSREYADLSEQREVYIHGVTGFGLEPLEDVHYELMRDQFFGDAKGEVLDAQGAQEADGELVLTGADIFSIPADATFAFDENGLSAITYRLPNELSYYSAFISLFVRYADPVTVAENGDMSWSLNDALITLTYDKEAPTLRVQRDVAP